MNDILRKKYSIFFENKIYNFRIIGKESMKIPSTNLDCLTGFLYSWKSSKEIEEFLLPDIYDALNGSRDEIENGSEVMAVLISRDKIVFYPDDSSPVAMPTEDFKEIILAWKIFLETSPLDGSKV